LGKRDSLDDWNTVQVRAGIEKDIVTCLLHMATINMDSPDLTIGFI
jgi:hypothetical protein